MSKKEAREVIILTVFMVLAFVAAYSIWNNSPGLNEIKTEQRRQVIQWLLTDQYKLTPEDRSLIMKEWNISYDDIAINLY